MYDDLIKAIRQNTCHFDACGMCLKRNARCLDRIALQAADAIEDMSEYVNTMRRLKCEGWLLYKLHDGCQVVSTMQIPQPPEEE